MQGSTTFTVWTGTFVTPDGTLLLRAILQPASAQMPGRYHSVDKAGGRLGST